MPVSPQITEISAPRCGWRVPRCIADPILAQLQQGITPEKIALSIAIGVGISVFPVLGATTLLCLVAGIALKLNQPLLQLVNYLAYPLQLILIPVFIRAGERLFRAPNLPFSIAQLTERFHAGPLGFVQDFGITLLHASAAWLLIVPPLAIAASWMLRPVIRAAAGRGGGGSVEAETEQCPLANKTSE